jgi:hypothetical protein
MDPIVCRHCHATVPDAGTRCPRCGQPLGPPETHVTAHPIAAQAIRANAQPEYQPAAVPPAPEPPRGRYASWEDFRANSPVVQRTLVDLATRVLPDMRNQPREPLPADLPPPTDALGVPLASVTLAQEGTSAAKLVVHRIVVMLILVSALTGITLIHHHGSPRIGIGLFLAVTAVLLAVRYRTLRAGLVQSVRLWLFENGILWQEGARVEACRFEDIAEFRVPPEGPQRSFTLVPRRGVTLLLTLRSSVALLPLAEYIEIRMASAQLLPTLERILAGERVRFGAVVLDGHGFEGPGVRADWSQIVRVMGDRRQVFVECRDQAGWCSIRVGAVSCPLLMLNVAHILLEEAPRLPVPPLAG